MPDTLLNQLRQMSTVVADTGDFGAIARFKPRDSTTNPSLIAAAAKLPQYQSLVDDLLLEAKSELGNGVSDQQIANLAFRRLAVAFGKKILAVVSGRVSTEVDARMSFDREATLEQARDVIEQYDQAGIGRERVLIKIAATWEGIQAARELEKEGIHCNLTLVFGLHQAAACAAANVTLISPFVGRILDWCKKDTGKEYSGADDPGVQSVTTIYNYLKQYGFRTVVMAASFRNIEEITQLAGCDLLTISPNLLAELDTTKGSLPRKLWSQTAKEQPMELLTLDQIAFERMHHNNRMASDLLSEGIEGFSTALKDLETLLSNRLTTLGEGVPSSINA